MARTPVSRGDVSNEVLADNGVIDEEMLADTDEAEDNTPPYRLVGKSSIPVSRNLGTKYKDQIDNALSAFDGQRQSWDAAFKSYRACNDMGVKAGDTTDASGRYFFENNTDENLTRENVKTLLRNTYTANPQIELSTIDSEDNDQIDTLKATINQLLQRPNSPGLNAKSRVRRWVVHAHLTNFGVIKLDFQDKQGSRAEAYENLLATQEKMAKVKDVTELEELYADLAQIEQELPTTREPGMVLTNPQPGMLIIDPDCTQLNLYDAKWTDEIVMLSDAYIQRRFLKKGEDGVWRRLTDNKPLGAGFKSGHKNNSQDEDIREKVANEILGTTTEAVASARSKGKTKCHIVWDRLTKQISLWVDGAWDYPLWVYQDDLKLSRFYPYFLLAFNEGLDSIVQEGESAQYRGQEDEVNKINKRVALIRRMAFGQLIFNSKKIDKEEVKKIVNHMKNSNEFDAFGLDFDPEMKLKDMFELFVPPDAQVQALYDKSDLMRVVDRVSAMSPAQRGEQFKTNTTNKAVGTYNAVTASVQNELSDAIEDGMKDLVWAMLELLISKYTKDQVIALVGKKLGEKFEPMTVEEFNQTFSIDIAPGSTEKPSSAAKKQEAMQLAQAIGQVGQATPMTTLKIMFRMFKSAFSGIMFTKEDEEMLNKEATANMTKGQSVPGQQPTQPPAAQ